MSSIEPPTAAGLLRLARQTIEAHLHGTPDPEPVDPMLRELPQMGVFVTLRRSGQLRGCIGTFDAGRDIVRTIQTMAVSAAHDPRFTQSPISATELNEIEIEISLLSPLRRIDDPLDFELGRHGIYVKLGERVGCFLPEVATERGWSRETFLSECCSAKAGLDAMAWQQPDAEISVFTVQKLADQ